MGVGTFAAFDSLYPSQRNRRQYPLRVTGLVDLQRCPESAEAGPSANGGHRPIADIGLPEHKISMIAGILSAAALLLDPSVTGDRERRPVHLPFQAWAAETGPERQLDRLISEVVDLLEQGDVRFARWRSRDIRAEFGRLRLTIPRTTEGRSIGRNFLFDSDRFGIHFRARFGLRRLRLFVPSACRERVRAGRRGDEVRIRGEDFPNISAHELLSRREIRRRWRAVVFGYEMECGDTVRIRFYDLETQRRLERLDGDARQRTAVDNSWTGVTIFRAAD